MARYIDADALIGSITKRYEYDFGRASYVLEEIENAPTADVVEVVRCKDCAYKQYYFTNYMVKCGCGNGAHHETFFCADGERREEGDRLVMPPADGSTIKVDGERRTDDDQ